MKKYDQLIFAALLAAVFVLLSATLGLILPTEINVEGAVDSDLPVAQVQQTVVTAPTQPAVTTPPATQPATPDNSTDDTTSVPAADNTNDSSLPQGNEAILAKYSELMNDAKAKSVGFKKIEWQAIPEEKAQFEGKAFGKILPIASNFFKTEEDAKANPEFKSKDDDATWLPIYHNQKGCLLTDASVIENATCTELPDGNVKIVIELKDEDNSEPPLESPTCDSYIGSMFTPIQFASIRNTLETDPAVKFIVKNVDFDLTYFDCVAELTYNPATNQIVQLDQFMHIDIKINDGSILGLSAKGNAVLDNYMYISEFQY
ncbi:MAG: hypothetical protein J6Q79_03550 [Clostridia bacterium]|nr:hypothetical protein [Clostridia bacterium]